MFARYLLIVCLLVQSHCDESYTNKYDGVDLDEILASDRLLNGYISCLLETGPCTADAKELKRTNYTVVTNYWNSMMPAVVFNKTVSQTPSAPHKQGYVENLPDAIENDCMKCNKRQREGADKIMHFIIDQRPADWDKLEQKYNSDGSYKRNYLLRQHPEEQKNEIKIEAKSEE